MMLENACADFIHILDVLEDEIPNDGVEGWSAHASMCSAIFRNAGIPWRRVVSGEEEAKALLEELKKEV